MAARNGSSGANGTGPAAEGVPASVGADEAREAFRRLTERPADLLRFATAGSVDDGKSTLIGRLLYDSKQVFRTSSPTSSRPASAWATASSTCRCSPTD